MGTDVAHVQDASQAEIFGFLSLKRCFGGAQNPYQWRNYLFEAQLQKVDEMKNPHIID